MFNILLKFFLAVLIFSDFSFGYCLSKSCDPSITFALEKHRVFIKKRMNDLKGTIKALNKSTETMNEVCVIENIEFFRLKARMEIEAYKQVNIRHYYLNDTQNNFTLNKNKQRRQ